MIIDTFHSTKCIVSCHLDISSSYYSVWYGWYLHVMSCLISSPVWRMSFIWKIELYFSIVLLSLGQHLSLCPAIKTSSPDRGKLPSELAQNSVMYMIFFALLILVIFLKNICILLFGISWTFQNIVKMLLDNIRLYFILS